MFRLILYLNLRLLISLFQDRGSIIKNRLVTPLTFSGRTCAPGRLYRHSHTIRSQQPQSTQPQLRAAVCGVGLDALRHGKQEVCNTEVVRYGQQHTYEYRGRKL